MAKDRSKYHKTKNAEKALAEGISIGEADRSTAKNPRQYP